MNYDLRFTRLAFALGLLSCLNPQLSTCFATTTINTTNKFSYGANTGWMDWRGDTNNGAAADKSAVSGVPRVRSYALSFADGHVQIWKLLDGRTKNWKSLPVSNNPPNADWQKLQAASSSLK